MIEHQNDSAKTLQATLDDLRAARARPAARVRAGEDGQNDIERILPRWLFGTHPDANFKSVFALCAGLMAVAVVVGMLIGWWLAEADGYPVTSGVLGGAICGFIPSAFMTIVMRPPHILVAAITGGLAIALGALGMMGAAIFAPEKAQVQFAEGGAVQGTVSTAVESVLLNNVPVLALFLGFALAGLLACLAFVFGIVREVLKRQQ